MIGLAAGKALGGRFVRREIEESARMFNVWPRLFPRERVASTLLADQRVVLFPTAAAWCPQQETWQIPIHGWVYEPADASLSRSAALGALRISLRLERDAASTEMFRRRARLFLVDNEQGRRIAIRIGRRSQVMPPSGANGHFHGQIRISADEAEELQAAEGGWLPVATDNPAPQRTLFRGAAHLIPERGWSIISDVDDTIKTSEVHSKRSLLRNTFLKDFLPVPGMSALYRRWEAAGASFHYVTTTPWQLYEPLEQFRAAAEYPVGTWHMKLFRTRDKTLLNLWANPEKYKRRAIEPLLLAFPERRFILIGDSGQRDPQLYGALAREYPRQIARILIRDVTQEAPDAPRYRAAFDGVPRELWSVFRDPVEIAAVPLDCALAH